MRFKRFLYLVLVLIFIFTAITSLSGISPIVSAETIIEEGISQVVSGTDSNIIVTSSGGVYVWGKNDTGMLGTGKNDHVVEPVKIDVNGIAEATCGAAHAVLLKKDGTLLGAGSNLFGQLGIENTTQVQKFTAIPGISNVKKISCGYFHTMALTKDGSLYVWGRNFERQAAQDTDEFIIKPCKVLDNIVDICAGGYHCLALRDDGKLLIWGSNSEGQLGTGYIGKNFSEPQEINIANVEKLAAGENFSMALTKDGTLYTWGANSRNQLGRYGITSFPRPVDTIGGITDIVAGAEYALAVSKDNQVFAWGKNIGQFSDSKEKQISLPVPIMKISGFKSGSAGISHAIIACKYGEVFSFGDNTFGQCGFNEKLTYKTLYKSFDDGIKSIAMGEHHGAILKNDGTVYTFGSNEMGQLGVKGTAKTSKPVKVAGLSSVKQICCGNNHTMALTQDGKVYVWGDNITCQSADADSSVYVEEPKLVEGLSNVKSIAANGSYSLALKNDGTLYGWGSDAYNKLGVPNGELTDVPVRIHDLTGIIEVKAGLQHILALKNDGSVLAWGANSVGQLGIGTKEDAYMPTAVKDLKDVVSIACGDLFSAALDKNGNIYLWGGIYADEKGEVYKEPTKVFSSAKAIFASKRTVFILKDDGNLYSIGDISLDGFDIKGFNPTGITGVSCVAGNNFTYAVVKNDGSMYCWGNNLDGLVANSRNLTYTNPDVPIASISNFSQSKDEIKLIINGNAVFPDVPPRIMNDRTLVPVRIIFETLGATVDWDEKTQTVTGKKGDKTVKLVIDSKDAYVNDKLVKLDVPATIMNDRTLVPVRFIAESLGARVDWFDNHNTVYILSY